jgi:uncharacterized protein YjdB
VPNFRWTSSDTNVVVVVDHLNGLIRARRGGQATITATAALDADMKAAMVVIVTASGAK